ncbi:hypothetical protein BT69DRAFT_584161 [Atractiella rhizophila]|nr:hypothetical protein BT69DRAFT_584161 [Atractiella rhizophila]
MLRLATRRLHTSVPRLATSIDGPIIPAPMATSTAPLTAEGDSNATSAVTPPRMTHRQRAQLQKMLAKRKAMLVSKGRPETEYWTWLRGFENNAPEVWDVAQKLREEVLGAYSVDIREGLPSLELMWKMQEIPAIHTLSQRLLLLLSTH